MNSPQERREVANICYGSFKDLRQTGKVLGHRDEVQRYTREMMTVKSKSRRRASRLIDASESERSHGSISHPRFTELRHSTNAKGCRRQHDVCTLLSTWALVVISKKRDQEVGALLRCPQGS